MFRKRRRPTPAFKIPSPYNPIAGEQANLRQEGTAPYCAMMQVAAEDTYANYVICRGFDPRILKFVDYAAGNPDKPGISVAKPFGKRLTGTYAIGEIYPALLPTQGNAGFSDFRQVIFTPPSPSEVNWRVGQNPGVVTGGLTGGQPESLSNAIEILYDHNAKAVNWLLMDSGAGGGATSVTFWRFTLNSNWVAGTADADILQMDGTDTGLDEDILDPLGIFSTLEAGDPGICFLQNGNYYVIQAPCPT